jgi:undecaprenyl-diphosphatase
MNTTHMERRAMPRRVGARLWNVIYRTLRFVAQHVRGFYPAVLASLAIAFLGAAALVAFVALAKVVLEGATSPIDNAVLQWFAGHRTPVLTTVALQVTQLGTGIVLWTLMLVSAVFLWLTNHRYSAGLLLVGILGASVLNIALKDAFLRPRPTSVHPLTVVGSTSFPSGHAMVSFVAYAAVALLVSRLESGAVLRTITWLLALLLIAAIGVSRVYLGVHYPSDVVAGYLAGLAWIAFVATGLKTVRFFAHRQPQVRAVEHHLDAEAERAASPPS